MPRYVIVAPALAVVAAISAACSDATAPANCFQGTASFSPTAPDFVARVAQVKYESGATPAGGQMSQFAVWLTVAPHTDPNAGIVLSRTTPVFERVGTGAVRPAAACTVHIGDMLEVWHDFRWALGAAEAPPGDTLYFPTQIVIRR
jgi:hypothetical protein